MAYQCQKCNHYTPDGVKHECIYDELKALKIAYDHVVKELDIAERKLNRGWNLLSDIDMVGRVRYDEFFGDLDE